MNSPNPALVTQRAAQRLPRLALLLLCAAYLLPGLFIRDPWRSADITAFGYMFNIASGSTPWLTPAIGGLPADAALLPYWLGAAFINWFGAFVGLHGGFPLQQHWKFGPPPYSPACTVPTAVTGLVLSRRPVNALNRPSRFATAR